MVDCPNGFAIPENPLETGNWFPNRSYSECAFRCENFVIYSESEWSKIDSTKRVCCEVGLILIVITIIIQTCSSWCMPLRNHHYFVTTIIYLSFLQTITSYIVYELPESEQWCKTNTVMIDGPGITGCAVQGFITVYCNLCSIICCCILAITVFDTVVLNKSDRYVDHKLKHICVILLFPFIPCMILASFGGFGAFWLDSGICVLNSTGIKVALLPMTLFFVFFLGITLICLIMVTVKFTRLMVSMWKLGASVSPTHSSYNSNEANNSSFYSEENPNTAVPYEEINSSDDQQLRTSSSNNNVPSADPRSNTLGNTPSQTRSPPSQESINSSGSVQSSKSHVQNVVAVIMQVIPIPEVIIVGLSDTQIIATMKMLRLPIMFMIFNIMLTLIVVTTLGKNSKNYVPAFNEWGNCVLHHYNGIDQSWVPYCGNPPSEFTLPMQSRMLQTFLLSGNSIIVSIIAAPSTFGFLHKCYTSFHNRRRY